MERRNSRIKIGRRKTDIPVKVLEEFKNELNNHMTNAISAAVDTATEKHVNVGIRGITQRLDEYIVKDELWKADLAWLKDISQGTRLLKNPLLWFLAFVVGAVALIGGIKALSAGFVTWVMPK